MRFVMPICFLLCCTLPLGCAVTIPDAAMKADQLYTKKLPYKVAYKITNCSNNVERISMRTRSYNSFDCNKKFNEALASVLNQIFDTVLEMKSGPPVDADYIVNASLDRNILDCQGLNAATFQAFGTMSLYDSTGQLIMQCAKNAPDIIIYDGSGLEPLKAISFLVSEWGKELISAPWYSARLKGNSFEAKHSETPISNEMKTNAIVNNSVSSDIDKLPTYKKITQNNNYAVVIGIESYRQKLPKADYAVSDAKLVSKYLIKALGYPEENVITLTNKNASKSDLEKYLGTWLRNNVEKGGTVFIYYSGHGAPNPKTGDAYLVPYDGDPTFISDTGYPVSRLYDNLAKLPAKQVIVALDSCFSGAGGKSVLAKGARPLVMNMDKAQLPGKNIAVLAAASGDQISSSYEEKGHGVFTYFLLKGIKEQLDENKAAKVDLGNLYDYLKPKVERVSRKIYNAEQSPQLMLGSESLRKLELR